jgi:hypothetical protein
LAGVSVRGPADVQVAFATAGASYGVNSYKITPNEAEANAHMIAAAPEMYEAAMAVVTGDYELDRPGFNRALNRLRDALDMAGGRS